MLQRAASNAYSWWWASHIRTKQSKWLEQSLQDMEEKVAVVLKLIEEDGDSFRKRAEMYYKKRPELISFVEESFRAFRALAERYDHISRELQNANHTIATVFPDQVPFEIDDDDDDGGGGSPKHRKKPPDSKLNIPRVPKAPMDDIKDLINTATKKLKPKKPPAGAAARNTVTKRVAKSGLSKEEGLEEIDKKQKMILALQTEKEFLKSSYEGQLGKYWEIDQDIRDLQDKVYHLQDEFGAGNVIEDDEARNVMATEALRSCSETLNKLEEKQEETAKEAKEEQKRIKQTRKKLNALKDGFCVDKDESKAEEEAESPDEDMADSESTKEKSDFNVEKGGSLSVAQMAEKIDELVNKVVGLEATASSQTALIQALRADTDELQVQIQTLEDDNNTLVDAKDDLTKKLGAMEVRCKELLDLNHKLEEEKTTLQVTSAEAIAQLSEKLTAQKPYEESELALKSEENNNLVDANNVLSKKLTELEVRCKELQYQNQRLEEQNTNLRAPSTEVISQLSEDLTTDKTDKESELGLTSEERNSLVDANNDLSKKLRELEERCKELQDQNQRLEELNTNLRAPSTEAICSISQVSENLHTEKTDEVPEAPVKSINKLGGITSSGLRTLYSDNNWSAEDHSSVATDRESANSETKSAEREQEDNASNMSKSTKEEQRLDSRHMSNNVESQEQVTVGDRDEPDWKQLYMKGMEDKEKNILGEYTNVLRNYKQMKKKLAEVEEKNQSHLFEITLQMRDANALKDREIQSLQQRLKILKANEHDESGETRSSDTDEPAKPEDKDDIRLLMMVHQPPTMSPIEEKFRMEIDEVLEGNLNFWQRFSTTFSEIQKYESEVKDLLADAAKLEGKKKHEGSSTAKYSLNSDVRPTYKYLKEVNTEVSVWREKCLLLKKEVKSRFSSLCEIQEEITKALKLSAEDYDFTFTSYQAAKFQGEILNMKQENNRVAEELKIGLDHAAALQLDIEKTLTKLSNEYGLEGGAKQQRPQKLEHIESRSRVPLRSFIFEAKPKKPKSIFSAVNPALYRRHQMLRLALTRSL